MAIIYIVRHGETDFNPDISEQDFFDFVLKTANIRQYQFK